MAHPLAAPLRLDMACKPLKGSVLQPRLLFDGNGERGLFPHLEIPSQPIGHGKTRERRL